MAVIAMPSGERHNVEKSFIVIGSDPDCDIIFSEVSGLRGQHAIIRKVANRWLVESQGDWAIQVESMEPAKMCWVSPGNRIRLSPDGPRLVFEPSSDQVNPQKISMPLDVASLTAINPEVQVAIEQKVDPEPVPIAPDARERSQSQMTEENIAPNQDDWIDNLKSRTENIGHAASDTAKKVANSIKPHIRSVPIEWSLRAILFLVLVSTFCPWFGSDTTSGTYVDSRFDSINVPGGPSGSTTFIPFGASASTTGLMLILYVVIAATIAISFDVVKLRNRAMAILTMTGSIMFMVVLVMTVGKPANTTSNKDFGFGGWNSQTEWRLLWGSWLTVVFAAIGVAFAVISKYRLGVATLDVIQSEGENAHNDREAASPPLRQALKQPLFSWIPDLPLLFISPGRFYSRRGVESSPLQALAFCVGYTFFICIVSLLFISAKIGGENTPWRMAIYMPLFWAAVITIRGSIIGIAIQAKTKSGFKRAASQGFVIDSFSWTSFFTFWLFANISLFATQNPPTTLGPYIAVGVIGLLCRLHGYFLDLWGLSTISGIGRAVAGVLMIFIDGVSSIVIIIMLSIILQALFS